METMPFNKLWKLGEITLFFAVFRIELNIVDTLNMSLPLNTKKKNFL